ncbi:MAG: zinc-ribbon domain-containing protein [Bacilli bacterium]|nr:zinc-ribbon domain-containing protein [Bacilli bacterium]
MALIKCSECGKQISDQASTCPHCGIAVKAYTYCSNCGAKVVSDNFCTNCGVSTNKSFNNPNNKKMCGIALAGGITGICSLIIYVMIFYVVSVIGITAIVLSSVGLSKTINNNSLKGKGWAITGLVCGIVDVIIRFIINL